MSQLDLNTKHDVKKQILMDKHIYSIFKSLQILVIPSIIE